MTEMGHFYLNIEWRFFIYSFLQHTLTGGTSRKWVNVISIVFVPAYSSSSAEYLQSENRFLEPKWMYFMRNMT